MVGSYAFFAIDLARSAVHGEPFDPAWWAVLAAPVTVPLGLIAQTFLLASLRSEVPTLMQLVVFFCAYLGPTFIAYIAFVKLLPPRKHSGKGR